MPVGGWAAALGAALQNAAGTYQGVSRQNQELELEKQRAADAHNMTLLQKALAQSQVDNLPKDIAAKRAQEIYQLSPEQAFDNPEFIKNRADAGVPVNTRPLQDVLKSRVNAVESGNGGPVPSQDEAAMQMGVSPTTGAVLPPELIAQKIARQRTEAQAQFVMDIMQHPEKLLGGGDASGQPGANNAPASGAMFDPKDAAMRMRAKFAGLEGIFPAAQVPLQTQADIAGAKAAAEAKAKAGIPGSPERMQSDKALTALQSIAAIKNSMEKVYPGITTNPVDPSFNGVGPAAGAWVKSKLGHVWASPLTSVDANLKRLLPQELGALVPGARGGQLVQLLSEAQGEFGQGGSPGSFMTKLLEAEKALKSAQLISMNPTGQAPSNPSAPLPASKSDIMSFAEASGQDPVKIANALKARGYSFAPDKL